MLPQSRGSTFWVVRFSGPSCRCVQFRGGGLAPQTRRCEFLPVSQTAQHWVEPGRPPSRSTSKHTHTTKQRTSCGDRCVRGPCRPTAQTARRMWVIRHPVWLILRFRGYDAQSPFYPSVVTTVEKVLEFSDSVVAHLKEVCTESGSPAPKLVDRWNPAAWLVKTDVTDGHLVRTNDGIVCAHRVRRANERRPRTSQPKTTLDTPRVPHLQPVPPQS